MIKQDKKRTKNPLPIEDNILSSPTAKAERLKRVRNLANLTREEFCSDGDINVTTLISWEVGRFGGLSRKGAASVIARVAKEGVFVTPEWLLHEVGAGPDVRVDYKKLTTKIKETKAEINLPSEQSAIMEELFVFRKLNKHAIDFVIEDDAMLPYFQPGDYVAGTKRFNEKIKSLVGYNCIVQTSEGHIVMRNLQLGPRCNSYNLVSLNIHSKVKNAIVYDVELASAAPIIWHRKKQPC